MKVTIEKRKQARQELYDLIESNKIDLASAVKLIRTIYGLGQQEYADKVGVSKKTVTNIENGIGNPTINSANKLLAPMKLKLNVNKMD